jgi:hypothetical protein
MAGLILKIFNYEFLCFHTERNLREDARNSILKELDDHLLLGEFDYSQHELSNEQRCAEYPAAAFAGKPAPTGSSVDVN